MTAELALHQRASDDEPADFATAAASSTATPANARMAITPAQAPAGARPERLPERPDPSARSSSRNWYRFALDWAFAIFNSSRIISYVPTMWAIHSNGDSRQYSVVTWLAWVGANLSMALWLYEHRGRRIDKAIVINLGNAAMCLATCVLIWVYRAP